LQTWIKQAGQPSIGAIAPHLQQRIVQHSRQLHHRLLDLAACRLDILASDLQRELDDSTAEQQHQKGANSLQKHWSKDE
jgi:hypothetical protein